MRRESSQNIDDQAAEWAARMDRAPLSTAEAARLEAWLSGDVRRRGALLRARAALMHSEAAIALGPDYDPERFAPVAAPGSAPRRRMPGWGMALAASLALVALSPIAMPWPRAYATERGEMRRVPLGDGSTVTLNTATRVRVRYDDVQRRVTLVEGEAYFEVGQDDPRPFLVEVDGRRLSTRGAAFAVRRLAGAPVEVSVRDGSVRLPDASPLASNRRASLSAGGSPPVVSSITDDELSRALAWREGKIAFRGESLASASEAFARYSAIRIVIEDPALAREPVTGLFAANDPVGFGRAVARVFDAEVAMGVDSVRIAKRD